MKQRSPQEVVDHYRRLRDETEEQRAWLAAQLTKRRRDCSFLVGGDVDRMSIPQLERALIGTAFAAVLMADRGAKSA